MYDGRHRNVLVGRRRRLAHQQRHQNGTSGVRRSANKYPPSCEGFSRDGTSLEGAFASFPTREKKAPPPARRQRQKKKRAPAAPKGRYEASFNEERRKTPPRPAGLQIQYGAAPRGVGETVFPIIPHPLSPTNLQKSPKNRKKFLPFRRKRKISGNGANITFTEGKKRGILDAV